MPEWLIGAVLKTVVRASVPRVRIPIPPPFKVTYRWLFCYLGIRIAFAIANGVLPSIGFRSFLQKTLIITKNSTFSTVFLHANGVLLFLLHLKQSQKALFFCKMSENVYCIFLSSLIISVSLIFFVCFSVYRYLFLGLLVGRGKYF